MERMLFENTFEDKIVEAKVDLVEAEPNHSGTSSADIANIEQKSGFSKATLSKTLPAMIGYVQPLNNPTSYIFGFRPKGAAGSDPHEVQTTTTELDGSGVNSAIPHDTSEDFMIARKAVSTGLREVKIDMTTAVEEDVIALFGDHFEDKYHTFLDPSTEGKLDKVATFFFEYASTQMVKKTNAAFTTYLNTIASDIGVVTLASSDDSSTILSLVLSEMQSSLMTKRKKMAGRFWLICSPEVAAMISTLGDIFNGTSTAHNTAPSSIENTYVTTMGNMDIYMSPDVGAGDMFMGILGNANIASIYYNPYKEYMINGGADVYTGINNIFFRARDAWSTNPVDTFGDSQPASTTNDEVVESAASDYVVKANIIMPTVLVYIVSIVVTNNTDITISGGTSASTILITYSDTTTSTDASLADWSFVDNVGPLASIDGSGEVTAIADGTPTFTATIGNVTSNIVDVIITNQ